MPVACDDAVVLYFTPQKKYLIEELVAGSTVSTFYGQIKHDSIIGREFGEKLCIPNKDDFWGYILPPYPYLLTTCLRRQTQIIFDADASVIVGGLNLVRGKSVLEAGCGSGRLTCDLLNSVGCEGRVTSCDVVPERVESVRKLVKKANPHAYNPLNVSTSLCDVTHTGFPVSTNGSSCKSEASASDLPDSLDHSVNGATTNSAVSSLADAVILDLPHPGKAIPSVVDQLHAGAHLCVFLPSIEQVAEMLPVLKSHASAVHTVEVIAQKYHEVAPSSRDEKGRAPVMVKPSTARGHTAYLTFARKVAKAETGAKEDNVIASKRRRVDSRSRV